MLNKKRLEILDKALELEDGDKSNHLVCPYCDGGNSNERSLVLYKEPLGVRYICFRDKCGARGFVPSNPEEPREDAKPQKKKSNAKPFRKETRELSDEEVQYFMDKYDMSYHVVQSAGMKYCEEMGRVIVPVFSVWAATIGNIARYYYELDNGNGNSKAPKAIAYFEETQEPLVHFPVQTWSNIIEGDTDEVVVVEDIISATKVSQYQNCVALMGTEMKPKVVSKLMDLGFHNLKIFLDPDAQSTALNLMEKYKLCFNSCGVIFANKDPKDLTNKELRELVV